MSKRTPVRTLFHYSGNFVPTQHKCILNMMNEALVNIIPSLNGAVFSLRSSEHNWLLKNEANKILSRFDAVTNDLPYMSPMHIRFYDEDLLTAFTLAYS